jgi:hypothetical protein
MHVRSAAPLRRAFARAVVGALVIPIAAACAQSGPPPQGAPPQRDTAFEAMQRRGQAAMGVDQETSIHLFDELPNGGRIELQRGVDDPAGVRAIRAHLRTIQSAFSSGDFSTPAFVHMSTVPGATVMAQRHDAIRYSYHDLPRGGELRITTNDQAALQAIYLFLGFQRNEHHAGGSMVHEQR